MVECNQERPSKDYFTKLATYMNDKQVQRAFYDFLMEIDTESIDWIKDRPITEVYNDMREVSIDIELRFIINFIESKGDIKIVEISAKDFFDEFKNFVIEQGIEGYVFNNIKFGIKIKKYMIDGWKMKKTNLYNKYVFDIETCRKWFVKQGLLHLEEIPIRLL